MEFADFLEGMEVTEEEFEEQVTEAARSNLKEDLTAELIAEKENISMTDEEYEKAKEDLAEEMSYTDVEQMEEEVDEKNIRSYILRDQVKAWTAENCIQVEGIEGAFFGENHGIDKKVTIKSPVLPEKLALFHYLPL